MKEVWQWPRSQPLKSLLEAADLVPLDIEGQRQAIPVGGVGHRPSASGRFKPPYVVRVGRAVSNSSRAANSTGLTMWP